MFWGLVLEPGKRYSTVVDKSFHVSMAVLDCSSIKRETEILTVVLETEEQEINLCSLSKNLGILQQTLDLNFMTGDNITFECKGSGIVHLSGYLVPDEFEMEGDEADMEEEGEESEESDIESTVNPTQLLKNKQSKAEKRKSEVPPPQQNKKKKEEPVSEDTDSDEESDEDEEMESDEEELDDEDEEEEVESDDEDSEEETTVVPKQQQKKQQQKQNVSPQKQQTPGKQNKPNIVNGVTPNQQSGKKDKKKGQTPQTQTPGQNATTPKAKTPIGGEDGSPKKRVIDGGIVIKDLKIGSGQPVKSGKMVQVYYTGRLKSNNKVFDQVTKGDGFKFRLGKGEVIKGWDLGVTGMKVGGKRTITCPPNVAYGSKGSLPTIPPNSTLIFEVEVKAVN